MSLTIGWLYPDLMSTYGDRGNIICLKKRCEWRGIEVKIEEVSLTSDISHLESSDLLFMGGAQDRQQKIAAEDLKKNKGPVIKEMLEKNIPGLFVCGAYQFMGHYYRPAEGEDIPGLGIFDLYTVHPGKEKERCIGNITIESSNFKAPLRSSGQASSNLIVGFENHGGRTYLGKGVKPLGKVVAGYGNNGEDKTEGCIYINSIGTYLHGPLLPKNPHLADWLLESALLKKYGKHVKLEPLEDSLEWQAHEFALKNLK